MRGRLSIVAGLVVGIVAAVLLLGGVILLAPDSPAGPGPTPLAAATPATPATSSSTPGSASPVPSAVASASPATSAGASPAPSIGGATFH